MLNIKSYESLLTSTTFHQFLDKVLNKIILDLDKYGIVNGFIAFLDAKKINERFNIISSFGRFSTENNINVISAKEIDIHSIVYMSKDSFFKKNLYIDIIEENKKDIFLYLEFNNDIDEVTIEKLKIFFTSIKTIIIQKDWVDE